MFLIYSIYFLFGFSAFDAVTTTFFMRNQISLSASELIEIGIYIQLPWSIKIAFGSVVDSFRLFGSNRRNYLILGSLLMLLGQGLFIAGITEHINISQYNLLLYSGLLSTIGLVLVQSVTSTLTVELSRIRNTIGSTQVWARVWGSTGALLAALVTGYLASTFWNYEVFLLKMLIPAAILLLASRLHVQEPEAGPKTWPLIMLSLGFALFCILVRNQSLIFTVQFVVLSYLLIRLSAGNKAFLLSCLAIFLFRVYPSYGPGYQWWLIGGLQFDEQFLGHLRIVSVVADLVFLGLLGRMIAQARVYSSMLWLTVAGIILTLPDFLVYYQLTTVNPRTIMLLDTAGLAPLADLSMIVLGILIAQHAPRENTATYMAVTASFMNCALVGGDVISRYLNDIFTVTRTDYSQLGQLMLVSFGVGTILSIIALIILRRIRNV